MSNNIAGTFVQTAEAYGRSFEALVDGHWWVVGDYLENAGKCTKQLGANAYPYLYGGNASGMKGTSPAVSGYATPSKEIVSRFRD